ncbi:MAG: TIR domain-containing protein [Lachnospiraceae bacterium]|nr:TIR domain-containing protein [Lachnospiraceae bacterium]
MSQQYDAFISYRHAPLDMEMAKKVHTALETYHIPRAVQGKTGKKKMGRVFRDQEELPIGSDLDDNISAALSSSRYLIVICSPRTPESYWVCKEIETFIGMHGREHVLAVLIEGEPDESFPKQLLSDDEGNPVEPLAADVRGATPRERNSRFRTERLRLAAPVIGCTYDDLKQRHRERMIRRTVTIVSAAAAVVAAAGTAFGIYNSGVAARMKQLAEEKTRLADEILAEYKQKQVNQSKFYARESLSLLDAGNREDAVLVAKAALPAEDSDRPYVADAEYALAEALYAYDPGRTLKFDRKLPQDMTVSEIRRSVDRDKLIVTDTGYKVYVYDTNDWSLLASIEPGLKEMNYTVKTVMADADKSGVYVCTENELTKYGYDGKEIWKNDDMASISGSTISPDGSVIALLSTETVTFVDTATGKAISTCANEEAYSFSMSKCLITSDGRVGVCGHYDSEAEHTFLTFYDIAGGSRMGRADVSGGYILDMYLTDGDHIAVLSTNSDFASDKGVTFMGLDLYAADGGTLWSSRVDAHVRYWSTFSTALKSHGYDTAGGHRDEIVLVVEDELFLYDEANGKLFRRLDTRDDCTALTVGLDSPYAYISYTGGNVDAVDCEEGEIYTEPLIATDMSIMDTVFVNSQAVIRPYMSSELYILSYHEATDLVELDPFDTTQVLMGTAPDSSYYVLSPLGDHETLDFFDHTGKKIHTAEFDTSYDLDHGFVDNTYAFAYREGIAFVDPVSGEERETSWSKLGITEYVSDGCFSENGDYAAFWSNHTLYAVDMHEMKVICTAETEKIISGAIISGDGTRLYVYESGEPVYALDTADGSKTELTAEMVPHAESTMRDFMVLSHDGTKFAMFCLDGKVRVTDTADGHVICEMPLTSRLRMFIRFSPDDSCLMLQGDDAKLRIWDLQTQDTVGLIEMEATVLDVLCDDAIGIMAVVIDGAVYLLDQADHGIRARVPDAVTYLKGDRMFLLRCNGRKFYMTAYKDHRKLLEEAAAEFPGAVLDDERRVKYNIE